MSFVTLKGLTGEDVEVNPSTVLYLSFTEPDKTILHFAGDHTLRVQGSIDEVKEKFALGASLTEIQGTGPWTVGEPGRVIRHNPPPDSSAPLHRY